MDETQMEKTLEDLFAREPRGASAAYRFASTARGEARPDRDVDVTVLLDGGRPTTLADYPTGWRISTPSSAR